MSVITEDRIIYVDGESIFLAVCKRNGIRNPFLLWQDLRHEYNNPLRCYHNWLHIANLLDRLVALKHDLKIEIEDETWLAAFYHDIVYIPGWTYNEERSAEHAGTILRINGASDDLIRRVVKLILDTSHKEKSRIQDEGDDQSMMLCDADLYELATDAYKRNAVNVRNEFAMYSDEAWKMGRRKFLDTMLIFTPRIYLCDGSLELEDAARKNMQEELEAL